jgi:hypothetical protein
LLQENKNHRTDYSRIIIIRTDSWKRIRMKKQIAGSSRRIVITEQMLHCCRRIRNREQTPAV